MTGELSQWHDSPDEWLMLKKSAKLKLIKNYGKRKKSKKHARDFGKESCIVADWFEEGIRRVVKNIHGSHFTQYFGIPREHPLAGFSYEDIPLNCHGGLTFSDEGREENGLPEGFWWYGWDYAHSGDYTHTGIPAVEKKQKKLNEKDWTLEEVIEDGYFPLLDFKKFIILAERIYQKKEK